MKKYILIKLIIIVFINMISISQAVQSQTLSGRVYEGTTGIEPPASKSIVGVTLRLYGSNEANEIGTFLISTTTTDSTGWYGLPVRGAFDFYNIVEENPSGYNSDGATSVSGTVKTADWIQYPYDQLSQTTTGNKFWDKKPGPSNNPPIADANGPYTGTVNQPVQFDGSGSYDPDPGDSITSYEWDLDNDGQYDDATGVYPTWTWNSPTSRSIHLRVTDTHGATGTDSTYVRIEAPSNSPPIADANGPYSGIVSQPVQFDGSGSYDPDAGDSITSYEWDMDNDGQYDDATGVTPQHTWHSPYSGIIWLRVADTHGEIDTDSTRVSITEEVQTGSITIIKSATPPDSGVIFNFIGDLGNFTLTPTSNKKSFSDLSPKTYTITENVPSGWALGNYQITGDLDGGTTHDSTNAMFFIDLDAGEDITLVIYNYKPGETGASVGDRVWHDLDQDGLQDQGEPGLDSVQVSLYDQSGNLIAQTLTNSSGFYMFSNINPGSYFLRFSLRSGFTYSPADQGTDDTIDSDAQLGTGDTPVFTLGAGEHNTNMDAGMYRHEGLDGYDFGDAPDPKYPTLLASNGAGHIIKKGFYLGSTIDAEQDGQPTAMADGDNSTGSNDEDGVSMSPFIAPGQNVPITVIASDTGVVNAWLDFNIDGDWADAGEHFIQSWRVYPGANSYTLSVPGNASLGLSFARFRLSSMRQLSYDGLAPDGEVEDYAVEIVEGDDGMITIIKEANPKDNTPFAMCTQFSSGFFNILCVNLQDPLMNKWTILNPYQVISVTETFVTGWKLTDITVTGDLDNGSTYDVATGKVDVDYDPGENIVITFKNVKTGEEDQYDFGDAPDPAFPTLLSSNGARHLITPNLYLGSGIDSESDGQPIGTADGDDKNIAFPGLPYPTGDEDGVQIPPIIIAGSTIPVKVIVSAQGALNAWIDFNGNGSWADAGEHVIAAQPVVLGVNPFSVSVPASAVVGQTYARFRLSSVRDISFDGPAPDGEVEDYAVAIQERGNGNLKIIKDADPKDNTPFWISVIYGFMGGAAPYRDPLMNTSSITNAPTGTYKMGESVPAGWTLTDIVVIGDADNGSHIDIANATVDVDLDPGEEITVTFKNRKSDEDEMFDLGDAPDGTNHSGLNMDAYPGVPANFPTVFDPATGISQGPMHRQPKERAFLGYRVSLEKEADIGPDEDPTNNIVPQNNRSDQDYYDDGVTLPLILPDGGTTSFDYRVTVAPSATNQNFYVNVWFDWNRDGDWEDNVPCTGGLAPEWAVQNQVLTLGPGIHVLSTPTFLSTHPPFSGTPPPIWMRIMITTLASDTDDGSGPANGYPFGETEDYYFVPRVTGEIEYDFGDAPDNPNAAGYPTLHANGGAYHDVIDGFHLGALIDGELNGQPAPDALGDDNMNIDDEDGVSFPTPLIPGQLATIEVLASSSGVLNAWIDYNVNSNWLGSDEHVLIDIPVIAGSNPLSFNIPVTAVPGITFARFRLSRIPGLLSTGYGHAGEVEDYEVGIEEGGEGPPIKWRQIPLKNKDPEMPYTPYFFGWDVKSTYDGTYVADDWFCKSPRPVTEIHWWGSYTVWDSAFPPRIAPYAFHIGVWTDVPKGEDTNWSHPGKMIWDWVVPREITHEHVVGNDFHPEYMSKPDTCFRYAFLIPPDEWFYQEGDSTIYWLSISALYEEEPDSFVWGWKTREHFFHDDAVYVYDPVKPTIGAVATKTEPIDEGWDLAFVLKTNEYFLEYDFGDAPFERYPTYFSQNGAHHIYDPRVFLGKSIDTEPTGQPDHTCTGDDNDGIDDDDGIVVTAPTGDGATYLEVTTSCPGYLNAWMDFDNNGSWAEPEDQIFKDEFIPGGQSILKIQIPDGAVPPPIFSRFRFSTEPGLSYVGIAIDGEVEDYLLEILPSSVKQNEASLAPKEFRLYQNYPNPFNPETIIQFDLPADNQSTYYVKVSIYNIRGQLIRTLVDEEKSPGAFSVQWDGCNEARQKVNSGIYLLKISADDYRASLKMIILK